MLMLQKGIENFAKDKDINLLEKSLDSALKSQKGIRVWGLTPRMESALSPINQTLLKIIRSVYDDEYNEVEEDFERTQAVLQEIAKYWQHVIKVGVSSSQLNERPAKLFSIMDDDNERLNVINSHSTKDHHKSSSLNEIEGGGRTSRLRIHYHS
ncbi:MAG: hypothetical protein GY821_14975 [Gammaproteobacteria bacterium]|nr:hypothetical protein [Gammaproteobacteria bacterium]